MLKLIFLSFLVFLTLQDVQCDTYNFGECPKIKSFEDFNMTKFLGLWYIVEANEPSITCAKMDFEATQSSSKFKVKKSAQFQVLSFAQHIITINGSVKVLDKEIPAAMKIRWHWSSPSEYMVVFDTDYSNYAGIFLCSTMGIASETKIYTLSRTTTLNSSYKDKVKGSLKLNDFSSSGMTNIEHENCPTEDSKDTFKVKITPDTLSPKSVGKEIEKKMNEILDEGDCTAESSQEQTTVNS